MSNLLNSRVANTNLKPFEKENPSVSYSTSGRIKPLPDKAVLLPSSIIGSPIEYVKDLHKDVVSVGKAVKGKANDYELGRINDLGMKAGSLGIASYLFYKNPFNLSKTMEFVGFGSFFASMALWPKLAIQLPIKARTGVDVGQEYIDSQGRKKLLYQDPRYVLTDMLPREDLDNIGKNMGVSENLPDRDSFIKERAHKTAVQANTLWMMTAGFATPLMTALTCNAAERYLKPKLEENELAETKLDCFSSSVKEEPLKEDQLKDLKKFTDFLTYNKDKTIDDKLVDTISQQFYYMAEKSNVVELTDDIKATLTELSYNEINKNVLEEAFGKDLFKSLSEDEINILNQYMDERVTPSEEKIAKIADILSQSEATANVNGKEVPFEKINIRKIKAQLAKTARNRKLGELEEPLTAFYKYFNKFMGDKIILDKYLDARIGNRPDSYIANQWERFCGELINALDLDTPFSTTELQKIADGDKELIFNKLENIVNSGDTKGYNKLVANLLKLTDQFELATTYDGVSESDALLYNIRKFTVKELAPKVDGDGNALIPPTSKSHEIFDTAKRSLREYSFFRKIAEKFMQSTESLSQANEATKNAMPAAPGTLANMLINEAESKVTGAKSTFYRTILALDIMKQAKGEMLGDKLAKNLKDAKLPYDEATIERLKQACKDIALYATTNDYLEKFTTKSISLSKNDYVIVMRTLFDTQDNVKYAIDECLADKESGISEDAATRIKENYKLHLSKLRLELANWFTDMTPELMRRTETSNEELQSRTKNFIKKNDLVGQSVDETIINTAKSKYNSKKWMMIFGGAMTVLTGVTLGAGFMFGRKDKTERQLEEESKKDVQLH